MRRDPNDEQRVSVQDEGRGHKYFTLTCNLIDDLPLTLYERALYKCLKRICGEDRDGYCSRSTDTLAAMTGMSAGAVSKAKRGLLRKDRSELGGKALIRVEEIDGRPGRAQHVITLVDVWAENMAFYAALYERKRTGGVAPDSGDEAPDSSAAGAEQGSLFCADQSSQQSSPGELQSSQQSSPGELKKSLKKSLRRRPKEEQQQRPPYPPKRSRRRACGGAAAAAGWSGAAGTGKPAEETPDGAEGIRDEGTADAARDLVAPPHCGLHHPPAARGAPPAVFPVVPGECVQKLLDAGCSRADAEALVAEFPWERLAEQIAWLPWQNCENPRYWLPRYIRGGWPKPKGLRDHEAVRAGEARRREAGTSRSEEACRQKAGREAQTERRARFRDRLGIEEAEALDREAHERLLRDGLPGTAGSAQFWRDWVAGKGSGGRTYVQAHGAVRDLIIDEREGIAGPGGTAASGGFPIGGRPAVERMAA